MGAGQALARTRGSVSYRADIASERASPPTAEPCARSQAMGACPVQAAAALPCGRTVPVFGRSLWKRKLCQTDDQDVMAPPHLFAPFVVVEPQLSLPISSARSTRHRMCARPTRYLRWVLLGTSTSQNVPGAPAPSSHSTGSASLGRRYTPRLRCWEPTPAASQGGQPSFRSFRRANSRDEISRRANLAARSCTLAGGPLGSSPTGAVVLPLIRATYSVPSRSRSARSGPLSP